MDKLPLHGWLPFQGPRYHLAFFRVRGKKRLLMHIAVRLVAYEYINEVSDSHVGRVFGGHSQEGFLKILPDAAIYVPNTPSMFLITGLSPAKGWMLRPFPINIITDGEKWYPLIFSKSEEWYGRVGYVKMKFPRMLTIWDQEKIVDAIQTHIHEVLRE